MGFKEKVSIVQIDQSYFTEDFRIKEGNIFGKQCN